MPYYNSSDPQGMQQASGNPWYNPLSPYTNLGGGIQYLLAQMAGQKEQKKKTANEDEDRAFEMIRRELYKKQTEQGIEKGERERRDYQPPLDPLVEMLEGRNAKVKEQRDRIELEKERGNQARLTDKGKPGTEKNPLKWTDIADQRKGDIDKVISDVQSEINSLEASARSDRSAMAGMPPKIADPIRKSLEDTTKKILDLRKKKLAGYRLRSKLDSNKPIDQAVAEEIEKFIGGEEDKLGGTGSGGFLDDLAGLAKNIISGLGGGGAGQQAGATPAKAKAYTLSGVKKESELPVGTEVYQHPSGFEMVKIGGKWFRLTK